MYLIKPLIRAVLWVLSSTPFFVLYVFSDLCFVFLYYLCGYRRKVVSSNLRNSFPEFSKEQLAFIERQYYRHLCDLIVESLKMPSISEKEINKRVKFRNPGLLQEYYAQNKNLVAAIGHYGNWEWGGLGLSLIAPHKVLGVYKPLSNRFFNEWMIRIRSRFGMHMVPKANTVREVLRHKSEAIITALIADQTPTKEESNYWTTFLNQNTLVFLGPERLSQSLGHPLIFCKMSKLRRGYYEVEFIPLFDKPEQSAQGEITKAHLQLLEQIIIETPQYWLWSHKRWKHKQEPG